MTNHDMGADGPRADRPKRRRFSAGYKLRILAEYEAAPQGEKGAIPRREGLYDSSLQNWKKQRDAGALSGLSDQKAPAGDEASKQGRKEKTREGEARAGECPAEEEARALRGGG
jgi:transposase